MRYWRKPKTPNQWRSHRLAKFAKRYFFFFSFFFFLWAKQNSFDINLKNRLIRNRLAHDLEHTRALVGQGERFDWLPITKAPPRVVPNTLFFFINVPNTLTKRNKRKKKCRTTIKVLILSLMDQPTRSVD